jgi:hypothetical protein
MSAYQRHHWGAGRQVLSHGSLTFAHGTVDGRNNDRIAQLLARDFQLGAALYQDRLAIARLFES